MKVAARVRFMRYVGMAPLGQCWAWRASPDGAGYGHFKVGDRRVGAHRFAYEAFVAPIPEGLVIDHLCRNKLCVNPLHLEPVTNRENLDRGRAFHGRATHCGNGHEFTPENTMVHSSGSGWRRCRACQLERRRLYRARREAAAAPPS